MSGITLSPEQIFEVFGDVDPTQYADETEQRWGDAEAFRESQRRGTKYGKAQWLEIKTQGDAIQRRLGELFVSGAAAESAEAMDAVEQHRAYIARWFYEVPHEMHRGLGQLYVTDPRFTANYDDVAPGLAQWVHDAIQANADRHGG